MPKTTTFDVSARYVELRVDIAANVASQTTVWPIGGFKLAEVQVLYPVGHAALTGFRLQYLGNAIIPWAQPTTFLIGDNERRIFEANITLNANPQIITKNSDKIAHTLWFVAKLLDIVLPTDLGPAVDLSTVTPSFG